MKQHIVQGVAVVLLVGGVAACGSSSGAQSAPATVTATVTATPSVDLTSSSTTAETAVHTSETVNPVPEATGPPILRGITTTPKNLVLADVFDHPYWQEGLVSVPKHSGPVQALYSPMDGCNSRRFLELRFADQTGVLSADLAQALDSRTSGAVLEFKILADGRLMDTALVKFNGQGHLEAKLTGVSSIRLEVRTTPADSCYATAVVTGLSVTPGVS